MPLWTIYHPPSTFTSATTKAALAKSITEIYTAADLPPFYVNVLFQPIEPESFYIGGVARPSPRKDENEPGPDSERPFIRVTIQNIARTIPNPEIAARFLTRIDAVLKPFLADMGYDSEYSVLETSRDLWKIDGIVPPMPGSKAEQEWVRVNRAVKFEKEDGRL
ncbi:putative oxalocrotonate tautomerase [Phaeosphaeria sp. MPI-PUGE-AT-0046c]|nr:putative oxalocrotonate tautomerase [Phaeosphaeria sp. MPI-PUGE-AT-0046c]